jgi:hypothetical protein
MSTNLTVPDAAQGRREPKRKRGSRGCPWDGQWFRLTGRLNVCSSPQAQRRGLDGRRNSADSFQRNRVMELFRLIGDPRDLREMARLFQAGRASIQKIEDEYYLQLSECDLSGSTEVPEVARATLARLKSIARFELGNFPQVEIRGVSRRDPDTGQLLTYVNAACKIEGKIFISGELTVRLSDGRVLKSHPNQVPPLVEALLKWTETDKGLAHAFTLFGQEEHDWPGLYKVLDAIVQAFGRGGEKRLIARGWVTRSEIKLFRDSSLPYRHGFAPGSKERENKRKQGAGPTREMTLAEAEIWITKILKNWVTKASQRD